MTLYRSTGIERRAPAPTPRVDGSFVNTTLGKVDYVAMSGGAFTLATITLAVDRLYAVPFWAPDRPGATIGRLAVENTNAVGGALARIGLYRNVVDRASFYPGARLADSGDISMSSTGIQTYALSQELEPNVLYWLALIANSTRVVRAVNTNVTSQLLGMAQDATGTYPYTNYIYYAGSFGALPDPWPSGGAYLANAATPALRYQFSA